MADYTTIDNPELYFQLKLYTGNGGTQSITLGGDEDMQPDFVWIADRTRDDNHPIFDSVRGAQKEIQSDSTAAEVTRTDSLSAFDSDGFSLGLNSMVNYNTDSYVAWCWKETATAGFDIVSYAGDGSAGRSLSHSLSATPHFILVKNRDDAVDWFVYHQNLTDDYNNKLNTNDAEFGGAYIFDPTSSIFKLRDHNVTNDSGDDYIAYAWAEKQGYSKFGTYAGNGSTDGAFIYTGFKPACVILKCKSHTGTPWTIWDNKRPGYNVTDLRLRPDTNDNEDTSTADPIDLLSNGFKCRGNNDDSNKSGSTYIYMAWAESPFVNSNKVPNNAG